MLSINIIYTQTNYFPEKGEWETKSPSELGYDEDKINDAIKFYGNCEYSAYLKKIIV